jgi:hypothetical protein
LAALNADGLRPAVLNAGIPPTAPGEPTLGRCEEKGAMECVDVQKVLSIVAAHRVESSLKPFQADRKDLLENVERCASFTLVALMGYVATDCFDRHYMLLLELMPSQRYEQVVRMLCLAGDILTGTPGIEAYLEEYFSENPGARGAMEWLSAQTLSDYGLQEMTDEPALRTLLAPAQPVCTGALATAAKCKVGADVQQTQKECMDKFAQVAQLTCFLTKFVNCWVVEWETSQRAARAMADPAFRKMVLSCHALFIIHPSTWRSIRRSLVPDARSSFDVLFGREALRVSHSMLVL